MYHTHLTQKQRYQIQVGIEACEPMLGIAGHFVHVKQVGK
jgi:hypothetical protein